MIDTAVSTSSHHLVRIPRFLGLVRQRDSPQQTVLGQTARLPEPLPPTHTANILDKPRTRLNFPALLGQPRPCLANAEGAGRCAWRPSAGLLSPLVGVTQSSVRPEARPASEPALRYVPYVLLAVTEGGSPSTRRIKGAGRALESNRPLGPRAEIATSAALTHLWSPR